MTLVRFDVRQITGVDPGVGPAPRAGFDITPGVALELGDYLLSANTLRIWMTEDDDGIQDVELPVSGDGEWLRVRGRNFEGAQDWFVQVPVAFGVVDFVDLVEVDPSSADPAPPAASPWKSYIDAAIDAVDAALAAVEASDVDSVAGLSGTVSASGLKTALSLPADTAGAIADEIADRIADVELAREEFADADTALHATIAAEITTAVQAAKDELLGGNPSAALDTLLELGDMLSDEADALAALTTLVATKATAAALDAEAVLARNADNLTSGTVPDARIPAAITRDSEVAALVAAELVAYQPGLEIGYAERTTSATSVQTVANATGTIGGLSVTVVGTGRPVDVRFACALSWNSVANKNVFASLMVNGGASGAASGDSSPATNTGPGQAFTRRLVLTAGVSYTFTVALYTESGGGTVTAFANATYPMSLSVTNR